MARLEVAAFMVCKPLVEDGGDVVVSRAGHPGDVTGSPRCDVKADNSLLRTTKNEPRNCIDIESDFCFESEPKVFSLPRSISHQEEYFAPGSTSVRHPD